MKLRIITLLIIILSVSLMSKMADAGKRSKKKHFRRMKAGSHEVNKPLEVRGQSRTLKMMLVLKSKKEKIQFIKVSRNYRREILDMVY